MRAKIDMLTLQQRITTQGNTSEWVDIWSDIPEDKARYILVQNIHENVSKHPRYIEHRLVDNSPQCPNCKSTLVWRMYNPIDGQTLLCSQCLEEVMNGTTTGKGIQEAGATQEGR